jgi:hypothetical protein
MANSTQELQLRRPDGKRDRIASPAEGAALIAAVDVDERVLWATAFYAGLRRGELRALRWTRSRGLVQTAIRYEAYVGQRAIVRRQNPAMASGPPTAACDCSAGPRSTSRPGTPVRRAAPIQCGRGARIGGLAR